MDAEYQVMLFREGQETPDPTLNSEVLTEMQYLEDSNEMDNMREDNEPRAPVKRRRNAIDDFVPGELKNQVRRKLFTEDGPAQVDEEEVEQLRIRPTLNRFVYGDEVLDLRNPLPGFEGASVILTNVFNTFMYIVHFKSTLLSLKNRKLTIQLRTDEHHLRQLEKTNYDGAHIHLPRMVESLFSMLDYRHNCIFINQLKPVSCVLNKRMLMEHISFRSMEATSKNDSNYIELMFNNPFRFIFVGCAKRTGMHNKNEVSPFPFFGEYINRAMDEMFEALYDLVSREIKKAKKEVAEADELETKRRTSQEGNDESETSLASAAHHQANSLQMMEAFSNSKNASGKSADMTRLHSFLRSIKMPLAKKETVDILITSGNSGKKNSETKMNYLTVESNDNKPCLLKMVDTDVTEDSIYLSSYIRCRVLVLDQAKFGLQIYTRHAIQLLTIDDRLVKFEEMPKLAKDKQCSS